MKKPDITKGEWKLNGGVWIVSDKQEKGTVACTANAFVDSEIKEANAKAISAVPEMIDALIAVYNDLKSCDDWGTDISTTTIEKVITSLLGVGCTDD